MIHSVDSEQQGPTHGGNIARDQFGDMFFRPLRHDISRLVKPTVSAEFVKTGLGGKKRENSYTKAGLGSFMY